MNTWIKDTMLYITERKKFEGQGEREIMNLFRFLGLKHRIKNPSSGNNYHVDKDIMRQLERAICDSSLRFFVDDPEGVDSTDDDDGKLKNKLVVV